MLLAERRVAWQRRQVAVVCVFIMHLLYPQWGDSAIPLGGYWGYTLPMATRQRNLRIDDDLWNAFGNAIKRASPELDRSAVMRELIRWYAGDTDQLPARPAKENLNG